MGSPVSPIVANLFMHHLEVNAFEQLLSPPRVWRRYVDDTFVILKKQSVESFHETLNSLCPTIGFTLERESEQRTLPFLDCCVKVDEQNKFRVSIYRKPTHSDLYLNYLSAHPQCIKRSMVSSLAQRLERLCSDPVTLKQEQRRLKDVLQDNGYPRRVVQRF